MRTEQEHEDDWRDWRANRRKEVAGNGNYPLDPKCIDEFITTKARSGPEWAVAYALLQVASAIQGAGKWIGGVDDFTGIMRIGAELGAMRNGKEKGNE